MNNVWIISCRNLQLNAIVFVQLMDNDRVVPETLLSIFNPMLESLHELDDFDRYCLVLKAELVLIPLIIVPYPLFFILFRVGSIPVGT